MRELEHDAVPITLKGLAGSIIHNLHRRIRTGFVQVILQSDKQLLVRRIGHKLRGYAARGALSNYYKIIDF